MTLPASFDGKLSMPIVASPMFLISGPALVTECCKNGVIGTFPALNQRTTEGFDAWLNEIKADLAAFEAETGKAPAPYGVNLIVHHTNPRLQADLEICVKQQVPLIITSLGAVSDLVDAVHSYGGLVYHDVTNLRHAQKAAQAGVDGLILVTAGAGGHAGTGNPFALVNEIKRFFDGTILLAGCLSTGQDVAGAIQMGADLAYMGTRFINTIESRAQEAYKQMIIDAQIKDIVYTPAISGVPANFMWPSLEQNGFEKEMLDVKSKVDFGEELDEAKAWKTIWSAGQGVTSIEDVLPAKELIEKLRVEFKAAVDQQVALANKYLAAEAG